MDIHTVVAEYECPLLHPLPDDFIASCLCWNGLTRVARQAQALLCHQSILQQPQRLLLRQ